jgi:hypothetical protein
MFPSPGSAMAEAQSLGHVLHGRVCAADVSGNESGAVALGVVFVLTPVLAVLAGYAGGTTAARAVSTLALAPFLLAVWAAYGVLSAPTTSAESDCHHCAEILGHWTDPLTLVVPGVLAVLWAAGALLGIGIRRFRLR